MPFSSSSARFLRVMATFFRMEKSLIPKTSSMTPERRKQLLETAKEKLLSGGVPDTPYTDEMWAEA